MALWGPIAYLVAFAPTAWMLDTLHLRPTAVVASALILAGCLVRMISTDDMPLHNGTNTTLTTVVQHVGQMLNSLAGPFGMSGGTVVSAAWFPPGERTISTAVFCTASAAGVTLSYLVGPLLVPSDGTSADVRFYLWICVGMAAAVFVMTVAYLPSKPPAGTPAPTILRAAVVLVLVLVLEAIVAAVLVVAAVVVAAVVRRWRCDRGWCRWLLRPCCWRWFTLVSQVVASDFVEGIVLCGLFECVRASGARLTTWCRPCCQLALAHRDSRVRACVLACVCACVFRVRGWVPAGRPGSVRRA